MNTFIILFCFCFCIMHSTSLNHFIVSNAINNSNLSYPLTASISEMLSSLTCKNSILLNFFFNNKTVYLESNTIQVLHHDVNIVGTFGSVFRFSPQQSIGKSSTVFSITTGAINLELFNLCIDPLLSRINLYQQCDLITATDGGSVCITDLSVTSSAKIDVRFDIQSGCVFNATNLSLQTLSLPSCPLFTLGSPNVSFINCSIASVNAERSFPLFTDLCLNTSFMLSDTHFTRCVGDIYFKVTPPPDNLSHDASLVLENITFLDCLHYTSAISLFPSPSSIAPVTIRECNFASSTSQKSSLITSDNWLHCSIDNCSFTNCSSSCIRITSFPSSLYSTPFSSSSSVTKCTFINCSTLAFSAEDSLGNIVTLVSACPSEHPLVSECVFSSCATQLNSHATYRYTTPAVAKEHSVYINETNIKDGD